MDYQDIVKFHGHECPGLAIGYRMAKAGMKALSEIRSEDEEIVAIVENDACGVDALQCVTGCTFGKGNFIFRDYGKHVYTLFSRKTGKGVRIMFHAGGAPEGIRDDRMIFLRWVLSAEDKDLLAVEQVQLNEPEKAQIYSSHPCESCGESTMETRLVEKEGEKICIPCSDGVRG